MQVDLKDKGQGGEMPVGHLKQIFPAQSTLDSRPISLVFPIDAMSRWSISSRHVTISNPAKEKKQQLVYAP
jgi:hypothetical protein